MKIWSPRVGSLVVFFQPPYEFRLFMNSLTGSGTVSTILLISMMKGVDVSLLDTVSFQHITRILEVTDELDISREAVEIPLSAASPGVVRRLPNGKLEIVVDADLPFDDWVQTLPEKIRAEMPDD